MKTMFRLFGISCSRCLRCDPPCAGRNRSSRPENSGGDSGLIPGFERATGHKVKATFGSGLGTKRQVAAGDPFDVPIVQPPYPEVIASGHVVVSSATPLATVSVGVAVRSGQRKPDISTPDAVRKMLLAARSISYPDPAGGAAAGVSFTNTLKDMGSTQVKPKIHLSRGGAAAMDAVAKGEVEIGLTFYSEILTEKHRRRGRAAGVDLTADLARRVRVDACEES
jgi:ABC-type molybdate transport system substrate-binding protein